MNKKLDNLRDLNIEELNDELGKTKQELFQLRLQLSLKQLEDTSKISQLKKKIAQILTIKTQKQKVGEGV